MSTEATRDEVEAAFADEEDGCCGCTWTGLVDEMLRYLKRAGLVIVKEESS